MLCQPIAHRLHLLLILTASLIPYSSEAQVNWTGGGANDNWQNAQNWSTGVPTSGQTARLDTLERTALIRTATGTQTISGLYVGFLNGKGSLRILNDGVLNAGILNVSYRHNGSISIESGGTLNTNFSSVGGYDPVVGTVTVTGAGSTWTNSNGFDGAFIIGDFEGIGIVNVQNSGTLKVGAAGDGTIVLGYDDLFGPSSGTLNIGSGGAAGIVQAGVIRGGPGTAVVNFNHSDASYDFAASITGSTKVNQIGTGTTVLTAENTYTGGTTVQGGELAVSGSITHTGADLLVGATGGAIAKATVRDGGAISVRATIIGDAAGTTGEGEITGGTWAHTGDMTVGNYGTGTLTISGGTVSNVSGYVGRYADSTGTVTVSGTGTWSGTTGFSIGGVGSGTLNLQAGGTVTGGQLSVGTGSSTTGSDGVGVVNMSGGTMNFTSAVRIGNGGSGTLNLTAGSVTSGDLTLGDQPTGSGTVTMDAGSWTNETVRVGGRGTGSFTLNGGTMSSAQGIIGADAGSTGTATVTGGRWNVTDLFVGYTASGTMTISGGLVDTENGTFLAIGEDATGDLTVSGSASGTRGVLATQVIEAYEGEATVTFDGGVLRAKVDEAEFFKGFDLGGVNLAGEGLFMDTDGFDIGFTNVLAGAGALTKQSAGALTLSAANTYSQGTVLQAGTIVIGHDQALGTGTFTINGGAVATDGRSYVLANNVALNGNTVFTIPADGMDGQRLELQGAIALGSAIRTVTLAGTEGELLLSGVISGGGGLNFQTTEADGFLVRYAGTSDNTYTGLTTVGNTVALALGKDGVSIARDLKIESGGFVGADKDNQFGATSQVTVDGEFNLFFSQNQRIHDLQGSGKISGPVADASILTIEQGNFSGTISELADEAPLLGLRKDSTGILRLSGASTYAGGTTIAEGTLQTANTAALGSGAVSLNAGGTLELVSGTDLKIADFTWTSGGTIKLTLDSGSLLTSTGILTQSGTGVFEFAPGSITANEAIALMTFQNTGATLGNWSANTLGSILPTFSVIDSGTTSTLYVSYLGSFTGPVINNFAPDFTPTNADFQVSGATVALAGVQTVASLTFADGGTLSITDFLALLDGTIDVPTGAGIVRDGVLIALGDLIKIGAGLIDLRNFVATEGNTVVREGTLAVNGTLNTDDVLVQAGAWLKGNGVIFGNVINRGTVAPGNSPGTLTITGNFTQTSAGTLQEEIASLTNFDRLIVGGTANLGGTLAVVPFGGFELEFGQQFQGIVQAGEFNGTFDNITAPDGFRGRVLENGGVLTLVIAPESYTQVAENQNQRNVAKSLDSFIGASGERDVVSTALDLQTAEQYPAAFEAITPGFFSSLPQISLEQMTAQNQFIAQRLSAVRLGINGFNAQGINMPLTNDKDGKSVMEAKDAKTVITPANATKWALWVQGNGIFGRMSLTNLPTNRFASGGFLGGADYRWSENFSTGIYSGYQGTYSKYSNGSSTTINSTLFGLYATYQQGGFYSDAIVGGAYNNYSNRRSIEFSTIDRTGRSEVGGGQLTAYLDAGYDWQVGKFTFGPLASLQYTYTGLGGFTESGADSLDLAVGQYNSNSIQTNLGGRIAYTWNVTDQIIITPEVRMFWQHEYLNDQQTMSASLDGGAGPSFGYTPSSTGQDSVFAGAGVSAQFGPNWNAYFYYNADFGRRDYVGQMISGGINWKF